MKRTTCSSCSIAVILAIGHPIGGIEIAAAATPSLERGRYLVEGVGACGNCHYARDESGRPMREFGFSGGFRFEEPHFGIAYAANITPDAESGIGSWSVQEVATAIRDGRRPDGSLVGPPMPIEFYRSLSDADVASIAEFLLAQPPIANVVPESEYAFTTPPDYGPPVQGIATPTADDPVRYGEYLVAAGHCMECHTPRDATTGQLREDAFGAGGRVFHGPWGESVTRDLTPHESGLRDWSDAEIAAAIRTGKDREGQAYKPPMAFAYYADIDDADMSAIVAYLRTLEPIPFGGPD